MHSKLYLVDTHSKLYLVDTVRPKKIPNVDTVRSLMHSNFI